MQIVHMYLHNIVWNRSYDYLLCSSILLLVDQFKCYLYVDACSMVDCASGYECLVFVGTGEAYCSPNCEELNPCAADEQCVTTTIYCIRAPCPPVLSCEGKLECVPVCSFAYASVVCMSLSV